MYQILNITHAVLTVCKFEEKGRWRRKEHCYSLFLCDQRLFVKVKMIDVVRIGAGSWCPYNKYMLNIEWII